MNVRDVMLTAVPTVTRDATLREVATILSETRGSAVVVVDDLGRAIGIVSEAVLGSVLKTIGAERTTIDQIEVET